MFGLSMKHFHRSEHSTEIRHLHGRNFNPYYQLQSVFRQMSISYKLQYKYAKHENELIYKRNSFEHSIINTTVNLYNSQCKDHVTCDYYYLMNVLSSASNIMNDMSLDMSKRDTNYQFTDIADYCRCLIQVFTIRTDYQIYDK